MDLLHHRVQRYAWGSQTAIQGLLGVPADGRPLAELWLGGHPLAPSAVDRGAGPQPLPEIIEADPQRELGTAVTARFGPRLPFLLKVLAADAPLSLQVHPSADQALAGFAAEEAAGIPRDAPERNYRDPHHKPELLCAVTSFTALCGFRPVARSAALLAALVARGADALQPFAAELAAGAATVPPQRLPAAAPSAADEARSLRQVVTGMLTLPRPDCAKAVAEIRAACDGAPVEFADAADAVAALADAYPDDPGVIVALLLNHLRLTPGEALFVGPGKPHAYLSGCGVEVMAASDNVLRCGLTRKHIDVPELLRVTRFDAAEEVPLLPGAGPNGERVYPTPVADFRLSRLDLAGDTAVEDTAVADIALPGGCPQILLCLAGEADLVGEGGRVGPLHLTRGGAAFVPAAVRDVGLRGTGTFFRATTGD